MATRVFEKPVSRDMLDLQRSIAITANGNTHAAISTGQFVYVKNHSTLTDGLYVATDDIVEDGTLSSSNLTADTSGGLNALQAQIDENSAHIDNLQDGLAIVSDNNTHAAIASGQFVYVKNHGTLDEGMYKATAAIAQDETLSSSNLTAVADGGLNDVKSAIPDVVNNLTSDSTTSALSAAQGKALNSNTQPYDLGSVASLEALKTALNTFAAAQPEICVRYIRFYPSFTDTEAGLYPGGYNDRIGQINIKNATRFSCIFTLHDGTTTLMDNNNGTWTISKFTLNKDFSTFPSLYAGSLNDPNANAVPLNANVTDYYFIILHFMTNAEHQYQIIPTDKLPVSGHSIHCTIVGNGTNGQITYPPTYNTSINIQFPTAGTVKCTMSIYNNANFSVKLTNIWGFMHK